MCAPLIEPYVRAVHKTEIYFFLNDLTKIRFYQTGAESVSFLVTTAVIYDKQSKHF